MLFSCWLLHIISAPRGNLGKAPELSFHWHPLSSCSGGTCAQMHTHQNMKHLLTTQKHSQKHRTEIHQFKPVLYLQFLSQDLKLLFKRGSRTGSEILTTRTHVDVRCF